MVGCIAGLVLRTTEDAEARSRGRVARPSTVPILGSMMDALRLPSPLVEIRDELVESRGMRLHLKRDELIHPELPGNKWRKLKYNIAAAEEHGASTLLTFGGAYSNHIRATAAVGRYFDFKTIGIIRGERQSTLNDVLAYATSCGMQLFYMNRTEYRQKTNPSAIADLRARFGDFYLIPEGGSNALAVKGCSELVNEIDVDFDVVCCPCGTGGTLAGISAALHHGRATGISRLLGGCVRRWRKHRSRPRIRNGSFARSHLEIELA